MRDYPSVPNVFRVASTHSVNADGTAATGGVKCVNGGGGTRGVPQTQQQQQLYCSQQQQQQSIWQQINGNNGKLKQQQEHLHQQQQQQTNGGGTHLATTTTSASNGIANGNVPQQQQQQSYHNNNNTNTNIGQSSSISIMSPHKLTTTASIERNYYSASQSSGRRDQQQQQQQQQHFQLHQSPYATLPRAMPAFANPAAGNGNSRSSAAGAGVGVINTISGSIPATGLAPNGRTISPGSDLNVSLNNSCSDLNKLNGVHEKQQQQPQPREFVVTRPGGVGMSHYQKRARHCTNLERTSGGYLWILTPVAASISVAIVIAALAGPQWLFTEEKLPNANYNGTANFNVLDDGAFITKYTKSSLWILCTTLQGVETYNCIKIDYFPQEGYQPDPHDSTPAIPYTVTKSCPFFLAAGIFLLISFVVFLIPTCSHQNNLYYFSAGIMFIVSGLLMLIGLIAYISILKAEIGSKLRPRSTLQPALFKVTYGQSFFLFVFGFIATEFVGLLNIFLYISLQEVGYYSRLPCFTISNLHEKIKEGEYPHSHTYRSYKHPVERKPLPRSRLNNNNNSHHQIHNVYLPPPVEMELDGKKLLHQLPGFVACRKHPNGGEAMASAGLLMNNGLERRFYFEKPSQSKCNLHSKNFAKSLNELYTEPAPAVAPPPPPSAIKAGGTHTLPRLQQPATQFADLPQEFPLTRSVSTTTDIFVNGNNAAVSGDAAGNGSNSRGTTPHLERRNRRNMATNTRPCDTEPNESERLRQTVAAIRRQQSTESEDAYDDEPQRLCGLKRGIRKTKDELFLEFCKRAGMRPKPKNIYFIANEEEAEQQRRRRCNGSLVSGGSGRVRADANGGRVAPVSGEDDEDDVGVGSEHDIEHGFKQLQEDDEHIYVIQDNPQFLANPLRSLRRSSMYVEPTHLRKLNSNLSLTTLYPPDKIYQKSLDSTADIWPPPHSADQYQYAKSAYGGSQNRLHQDYGGAQIYQSRTLPRSFLKRSADSQDSIASANALHGVYSTSQNRLTNLMLQQQQQQQLQQHSRFLSQSHSAGIYNSALALHKSCEDLPATANHYSSYRQQQQQIANAAYAAAIMRPQHQQQQQQQQQQRSTAAIGNSSNTLQQPTVQWPAAIPSSPSGYAANFHQVYPLVAPTAHAPHLQHAMVTRSASGSAASTSGTGSIGASSVGSAAPLMGPPKFQRAYAFDEQRRSSAVVSDAFDLDEMERERRRSHASLFSGVSSLGSMSGTIGSSTEHYDLINGTAV